MQYAEENALDDEQEVEEPWELCRTDPSKNITMFVWPTMFLLIDPIASRPSVAQRGRRGLQRGANESW